MAALGCSGEGSAEWRELTDGVGSLEVGKEADFVVLDRHGDATTGLQDGAGGVHRRTDVRAVGHGDDRSVAATHVADNPVYQRGDL
jgi:cytosine/adenosine deaminase-related metal-dependent hydrolase